jgi:intracellular sulfur oxidation DsrE/DsrF family protein
MAIQSPSPERRSFLTRLNGGVASLAALAIGGAVLAKGKPGAPPRWQPARHEKDDWLDLLPGKHRLVFDTTTPEGIAEAILFANNFMIANRSDYGLQNSDMAIVIVARHHSTPFAFNDAIWSKYGVPLTRSTKLDDPKTKAAPKVNVYNTEGYNELLNMGVIWNALAKQGVQLAVCSMATRAVAGIIAKEVGGNSDSINTELVANLVASSRMAPAGIVAVNRAQERGYTLVRA